MAKKYWWEEDENQPSEQTQAEQQPQSQEKKTYWWEPEAVSATIGNDVVNQVNDWMKRNNTYFSNYQSRFSNRKGNYDDAYVSDSASWLESVKEQGKVLNQDAQSILDYMDQYKDYLDADWMENVKSAMNSARMQYRDLFTGAENDNNYWSQWETEDDYKQSVVAAKDYEAKKTSDLDALSKELEALEAQKEAISREFEDSDVVVGTEAGNQANHEYLRKIEELDKQIQEKKLFIVDAKRIQEGIMLSGVANKDSEHYDPEFKKYADMGAGVKNPEFEDVQGWFSIGSWNPFGEDPKNKVTYTRENWDKYVSASAGGLASGGSAKPEYYQMNELYTYMTEDEVNVYNYYLAKNGEETADKYLDSITETLTARKANGVFDLIEDNALLELAFGVAAGLDQFGSGMEGLADAITGNEEYKSPSSTQMVSGMVREDMSDVDLKWYNFKEGKWGDAKIFGNSLGQVGYDAVTTTSNMLPSILTSTAVNFVAPGAGAVVGTGLLGASAGGNAYQEMINLGYDKDQARAYAAMVGGSEAILQYALGGISNLSGGSAEGIFQSIGGKLLQSVDNAFARTAIKLGGNMLDEGLEEGLQEILTPWFKNLVTHSNENVDWSEVAYSTLLGALTAGLMEGGGTISDAVSTYKTGKNLQATEISAQRLSELGKTFSADTVAYQLASRVNENTGAYTMGRLFNEIGATLSDQNVAEITNALVAKGMDATTAAKNAEVMAYVVEGGQLTDKQIAIIEANDVLSEVARTTLIDANTTWNQRSKGYNEMLQALADEMTSKKSSRTAQAQQGVDNASTAGTVDSQLENGTESLSEADSVDTSPAKVKSIAAIKNQQATIKLEDDSEVSVRDADLDPDDGIRIETIASIDGISVEDANFVLNTLRTSTNASAQMDSLGAKEAYRYGFYGFSQDHMTTHGVFANSLTETQRQAIYERGQKARQKQIEEATPKKTTGTGKQTEIYFDSGNGNVVAFRDAKKTLTEKQTAGVQAAMILRKLGIGGDIYFFESYVNAQGRRVYRDKNGKEVKAPNGWYSPGDGSIHIDLNAGNNGSGFVLFTLAHELTHFIEKWSPQKYKVLADFLVENYEKGQSMDKLVRAKQAKLSQNGKKVSYKQAYSEVVADSMEAMLADGNVLEKLVELKAKDHDLFSKMKQFFDNLLAKVRNIYKGQVPDSAEGRAVLEMTDAIEKIQQLFAEALVEASENFQTAEKNTTEDGGDVYQIREIGNTGKFYVQADRQVLTGDDASLWGKQIENYINEQIRKELDIAIPTSDGHVLLLTSRSAYKLKDNHVSSIQKKVEAILSDDAYALKGRAATHIDELIQVARFKGYDPDVNQKHENDIGEDGFNYFEAYFRDLDGKYYLVRFSAALNAQEETVYSIGQIRQRSFPADAGSSSKKEALKNGRKASGDIIYSSESKSQEVKTALQLAYEKALKKKDDVVGNKSAAAMGLEVDEKTESVAPADLMSERTWTESDYVQERENAAQEIAKAIGVSVKKAKAYIDSVNSIAKMIAEDRVRLDYFSSPGRSSFVGNVEYGGSFDFSTLCKKRRLLTGTFTAIQKALPNTALTANEILDIRNRMKKAGLEVSCGLCYVEGSRANMGQFAQEFLKLYKKYYPDAWQPNMADVNTPEGIEWVRINHPEVYEQYEYFWNHYGTLKDGDKNLFASQQKPKLYQLHTEYKGEILDKFNDDDNVEEKNLNGGIRLQSFSDFEIVHLIDTMQIIMDMSRVGLAGQAYTKAPDFAWALGDTGLKINLSLIAKGVGKAQADLCPFVAAQPQMGLGSYKQSV